MPNFLKKLSVLSVLFALLAAMVPVSVNAASLSALRVLTTGGGAFTMAPGEVKNITVSFQNTGSTTWKNDGPGYISLYTHGPKYRTSVFDPGSWLSPSQVKRLIEPSVAPGGTGTLTFAMRAPQTEGVYKETFSLASENTAWIPGGEFTLSITVAEPELGSPSSPHQQSGSPEGANSSSSDVQSTAGYSAALVTQTASSLQVKAGKTVAFTALFKNTGTQTWTSFGMKAPDLSIASNVSNFTHSTWNGSQIALLSGQKIAPGESAPIQFFFTAPKTNGTHTAKFQLTANDVAVPDAFVELPVTVTEGAPAALNTPIVEQPTVSYIEEPTIRVAVLIVDEETQNEVYVTSYESDFTLQDEAGTLLGTYKAGHKVRAAYEGGKYVYNDGSGSKSTTKPLRFVPKIDHAVMTITNFDRRVTRGTSRANNTFRNVLEIRYNTTKNRTWVINELKMEYYLRGLAETSNLSHPEFQKTLLTAARTYAFYHWQRGTKHRAEGFHVDAYRDQVYWGYGQEEITPLITAGVEATRGQIVTYNGETAITAYFSRSDGRTRDWSEVWGGDVPWSKGVPVPCDVGKTLWGHGVGMSASGAICMAKEGQNWQSILKYFYTGIDITKKWK